MSEHLLCASEQLPILETCQVLVFILEQELDAVLRDNPQQYLTGQHNSSSGLQGGNGLRLSLIHSLSQYVRWLLASLWDTPKFVIEPLCLFTTLNLLDKGFYSRGMFHI